MYVICKKNACVADCEFIYYKSGDYFTCMFTSDIEQAHKFDTEEHARIKRFMLGLKAPKYQIMAV